MRNPDLYTAKQMKEWSSYESKDDGPYVPSRPLPFYGLCLKRTLKLAWGVLIGKYDALDWGDR